MSQMMQAWSIVEAILLDLSAWSLENFYISSGTRMRVEKWCKRLKATRLALLPCNSCLTCSSYYVTICSINRAAYLLHSRHRRIRTFFRWWMQKIWVHRRWVMKEREECIPVLCIAFVPIGCDVCSLVAFFIRQTSREGRAKCAWHRFACK